MKKYILGLLTGIIIVGSIGVVAYQMNANQITYVPKDKNWKVKTVKEAVDDIKENSTVKKICKLKSGEALTIGSKYECNPNGDGTTKYNFYVLRVDSGTVKLIMERNITDTVGTVRTMDWQSAMNFFTTGAGKDLGWKVAVDLPSAQDIADAVGNTSWKVSEKDYNGWFYLDDNNGTYGTTPVANSSNPSNYQWLYNYTRECSDSGCDSEKSLGEGYAWAYWTGSTIAKSSDSKPRSWLIVRGGSLHYSGVTDSGGCGVRPVITLSKSQL